MKSKLILFTTFIFVFLTPYVTVNAAQPVNLFTEQDIGNSLSYMDTNHVARYSVVHINPAFMEAVGEIETKGEPSALQLHISLFFEPEMVINFNRWERVSSTSLALIGAIEGIPGSEAIFVANGSILTANISLPGKRFHIRPRENGTHELHDVNVNSYPEHLDPIPVSPSPLTYTLDLPKAFDGTQIDVLVAYTAEARSAAGGTSAIEAQIDLAVAETNQGYINSGVTQRIRLVHKVEISYSEGGFDWGLTLDRLQDTADGYMDNIHALRDTYHADLVALIVNAGDYCGLGYLMQSVSPYFASYAFCLVSRSCATGYYSLAHEMGHNMGAHHDRATGGTGAYEYSHGYQATDKTFRTIMAYNCTGGCLRINYWSNPDVTYNGKPTGVLYTDLDSADNRRTLNNTVATVASFRAGGPSLSVQKAGNGTGTIASNPAGINCGTTCSSTFSDGSIITLTAAAAQGSVFDGWDGGGCSGTGLCVVTVSGSTVVTATFTHLDVPPELSVPEGTIGTLITITGSGFGQKKGKVLINGVATKIAKDGWTPGQITSTINKPPFPIDVAHTVSVVVNTIPTSINDTFTLRLPALDELLVTSGAYPDPIKITGKFFSTKKGKAYLYDPATNKKKNLKITDWRMNPSTGISELTFLVPRTSKSFPVGTYQLKISNKVGPATTTPEFTVLVPAP